MLEDIFSTKVLKMLKVRTVSTIVASKLPNVLMTTMSVRDNVSVY